MVFVEVILNSTSQSLDRLFVYQADEEMAIQKGDLLMVPFGGGNRAMQAFAVSVLRDMPRDISLDKLPSIKKVRKVVTRSILDDHGFALIEHMRRVYLSSWMDAIRLLIPKGELSGMGHKYRQVLVPGDEIRKGVRNEAAYRSILDFITAELKQGGVIRAEAVRAGFSASSIATMLKHGWLQIEDRVDQRYSMSSYGSDPAKTLNGEQQAAVDTIDGGPPGVYLLHGITGSGKTEVFLHLVGKLLERGQDSVILVPEIALTPQMIERVKSRFGRDISVYHSRLNQGEQYDEWMRVYQGKVKVAIGARSALFLPFRDLKLVVVDEEHELSYKSETNPKYVTRDAAAFMMDLRGGKVLLASATPSIEAYDRALKNQYHLVKLTKRAGAGRLPKVITVDLRQELRQGNRSILSGRLMTEIRNSLQRGRQSILFLNRRGLSGFVSCRSCGFVYKCPQCSVSLTKHQGGRLNCHHCGHMEYEKSSCPSCGSRLIKEFGIGTEKVELEVRRLFPDAKVLRMDRDTTGRKESYEEIYQSFRSGKADILIGTQMVAKGLDFSGVDLVGILAADLSMNLPDFRAYERTFQLITQVSGRAGRGDDGGLVVLQTYQPDNYPVTLAAASDYQAFFNKELAVRKTLSYPPEGELFTIVLSSKDETELIKAIQGIARDLKAMIAGEAGITVMGPSPCLISRLKKWYRYQLVVKGQVEDDLAQRVKDLIYGKVKGNDIRVSLDRNPVNMA